MGISSISSRLIILMEVSKPTFLRDEQYAFFIRFIYNTGERSSSYHIPGRPGSPAEVAADGITPIIAAGVNNITGVDPVFKVFNTAGVNAAGLSIPTDDGGTIVTRGSMGYWQSTEQYPMNTSRWGGLCGFPIRHHKMPDETTHATCALNQGGDTIYLLGVQFNNIAAPLDNSGAVIQNIVGYEVLTGGREGNKSIIAKGIIRNMMEYSPVDGNGVEGTGGSRAFMPNYPFNDLGQDPFLLNPGNGANPGSTGPDKNFLDGCPPTWSNGVPPPGVTDNQGLSLYGGVNGVNGTSCDLFSFHSPETGFDKIYLNASEAKIYTSLAGTQSGHFKPSEKHPKHKLLRNVTAVIGALVGMGYAFMEMRGKRNVSFSTGSSMSIGKARGPYRSVAGGSSFTQIPGTWSTYLGTGAGTTSSGATVMTPDVPMPLNMGDAPAATVAEVPGAGTSATANIAYMTAANTDIAGNNNC